MLITLYRTAEGLGPESEATFAVRVLHIQILLPLSAAWNLREG